MNAKNTYLETLALLGGGEDLTEKDMMNYCQYKSNNSERFCNMTSQRTCKRCRFFEPSTHAKTEIISRAAVIAINRQNELNKALYRTIEIANGDLEALREHVANNIRPDAQIGKAVKRYIKKKRENK